MKLFVNYINVSLSIFIT